MEKTKFIIGGKTYTYENESFFEYRSHINGNQTTEPNNWVANRCTDEDGNECTAWYYVSDEEKSDDFDLCDIDYSHPDDITDEFNHIIYDLREI